MNNKKPLIITLISFIVLIIAAVVILLIFLLKDNGADSSVVNSSSDSYGADKAKYSEDWSGYENSSDNADTTEYKLPLTGSKKAGDTDSFPSELETIN